MKDSYVFYKDKLNKEYLAVFDQIEMYVLSQNVDENTSEERLGELLDIFLSAEESGKDVREITGNNLERFCKTFCSDFSAKHRMLHIAEWFRSIAKILAVISLLDIVSFLLDLEESSAADIWSTVSSVNISGYLIGILIAGTLGMTTNIVLRRIMFWSKRISMKLLRAASCAWAVAGFVIVFFILSSGSTDLPECPAWVVFLASCAYLLAYHLLWGRKVKRQKIRLFDLVYEDILKDMTKEMEKKYEKARRKNLKKGKGDLTLEAFLDREEKDCAKAEKIKYLYYILPVIVILAAVVPTYLAEGFDGISDGIIFIAILLVIEYSIMLGLWKVIRTGITARRAWLKATRDEIANRKDCSYT